MRTHLILYPMLLIGAVLVMAMKREPPIEPTFTSEFNLDATSIFLPSGDNMYNPLKPGLFVRLAGEEDGDYIEIKRTVLNKIKPILFQGRRGKGKIALARVVEEREWVNGELVEVSYNYYAQCPRTGNVYDFGEKVELIENGRVVSREGTWVAGKKGAKPGLIMPQSFLLGARYCHGMAPDISQDRSEHMEMGLKVVTAAGTFENCVKVVETSPLEPDEESIIIYAPGVGIIADEELILIETNIARATPLPTNRSR